MTEAVFCPECSTVSECRIEHRKKVFVVRGESIAVSGEMAICSACGAELTDEDHYGRLMQEAHTIYREAKGILSPADITEVRDSYGLSQRSLAKLLGWGEITIQRYEKGAIPDPAQNAQLKDLRDTSNMIRRVQERGHLLDARTRERLMRRLKDGERQDEIRRITGPSIPSIENGYRPFDLEKLGQLLVFFARGCPCLPKTKALKLAFYADFLSYRERALSITGSPYARFPHGPVPRRYDAILGFLEEDGVIEKQEQDFGPYAGEAICAATQFDSSMFSADELLVMERVMSVLGGKTAKEVRDLSHEERGWLETPDRELIAYSYADELRAL